MKFEELLDKLDPRSLGEASPQEDRVAFAGNNPEIEGVAAVYEAEPGTISYIEGGKFASWLEKTQASALILPYDDRLQARATERKIAWIAAKSPRATFARAIAAFYQPFLPEPGIHPTALVDPAATIGEGVAIGAYATIERGARVGNGVCILPHVVIYPGATIGDRTVLHARCVIHERARIGADCVIHSGAIVGSEGFGFVPAATGWIKMEQSGRVVLEDEVEVGCNSTIDRPAVGETRIGRGTKIDNLVQVAHGCQVGRYCAFAAQTGFAGSVRIGDRVMLGGQVGVANQAKIGNGASVTAKSGILKDVPPGQTVSGYPAMPHRLWLKVSAIATRLPDMHATLQKIQRFISR